MLCGNFQLGWPAHYALHPVTSTAREQGKENVRFSGGNRLQARSQLWMRLQMQLQELRPCGECTEPCTKGPNSENPNPFKIREHWAEVTVGPLPQSKCTGKRVPRSSPRAEATAALPQGPPHAGLEKTLAAPNTSGFTEENAKWRLAPTLQSHLGQEVTLKSHDSKAQVPRETSEHWCVLCQNHRTSAEESCRHGRSWPRGQHRHRSEAASGCWSP